MCPWEAVCQVFTHFPRTGLLRRTKGGVDIPRHVPRLSVRKLCPLASNKVIAELPREVQEKTNPHAHRFTE